MNKIYLFLIVGIFLINFMYSVNANPIAIPKGWNYFGINIPNNLDSGTDRNISLARGYNLIGMSSYINYSYNDIFYTQNNGTQVNISYAIDLKLVNANLIYYDLRADGSRGYLYNPFDDANLRQAKAYWIYWNETGGGNLTLKNIGGSYKDKTIPFHNLSFYNGSEHRNITDAFNEGWLGVPGSNDIDSLIRYWDSQVGFVTVDSTESLSSWKGYVIWTRSNNVTLCVGNCTSSLPVVTIYEPRLINYYLAETIPLNVTATDDVGVQAQWYSLNSGLTNTTWSPIGTNTSFTIANTGNYNVSVWANDSLNNIGTNIAFFRVANVTSSNTTIINGTTTSCLTSKSKLGYGRSDACSGFGYNNPKLPKLSISFLKLYKYI